MPLPAADRARLFDERADGYDAWYEENPAVFAAETAALKDVMRPPGRALALGVGTGRFADALSIRHGLDPARRMLTRARDRGVQAVQGVGERLPFADDSLDTVLAVAVLAFVADAERVLAEARRVLVADGQLVVGLLDAGSPVAGAGGLPGEGQPLGEAARYRAAAEVDELFASTGFALRAASQTIFDPVAEITERPSVREGAGEGLFAALAAGPRAEEASDPDARGGGR